MRRHREQLPSSHLSFAMKYDDVQRSLKKKCALSVPEGKIVREYAVLCTFDVDNQPDGKFWLQNGEGTSFAVHACVCLCGPRLLWKVSSMKDFVWTPAKEMHSVVPDIVSVLWYSDALVIRLRKGNSQQTLIRISNVSAFHCHEVRCEGMLRQKHVRVSQSLRKFANYAPSSLCLSHIPTSLDLFELLDANLELSVLDLCGRMLSLRDMNFLLRIQSAEKIIFCDKFEQSSAPVVQRFEILLIRHLSKRLKTIVWCDVNCWDSSCGFENRTDLNSVLTGKALHLQELRLPSSWFWEPTIFLPSFQGYADNRVTIIVTMDDLNKNEFERAMTEQFSVPELLMKVDLTVQSYYAGGTFARRLAEMGVKVGFHPNSLVKPVLTGFREKVSAADFIFMNLNDQREGVILSEAYKLFDLWQELGRGIGVKVAVLDSGVDMFHPDFANAPHIIQESFVPHDVWPYSDVSGHGTHVCGIVRQMAPDAQLLSARVLGGQGNGGSEQSLARAIEWAIEQGVHIINLSLGYTVMENELAKQLHIAAAKGIVVVCAASNDGNLNAYSIRYPARLGHVICVGSHGASGERSKFSSVGREVDFLALGECIISSFPHYFRTFSLTRDRKLHHAVMSGTSMAAPVVAGFLALLNGFCLQYTGRCLSGQSARELLQQMSTKSGHHDQEQGYGLVNPWILLRHGIEPLQKFVNHI